MRKNELDSAKIKDKMLFTKQFEPLKSSILNKKLNNFHSIFKLKHDIEKNHDPFNFNQFSKSKSINYFKRVDAARWDCQKKIKEIDDFVKTMKSPDKTNTEVLFLKSKKNMGEKNGKINGIRNSLFDKPENQKDRPDSGSKMKYDKFDFTLSLFEDRILVTLIPSRAVETFTLNELIEKTIILYHEFYAINRFDEKRMINRFKEMVNYDSLNSKEFVKQLFFTCDNQMNSSITVSQWKTIILGVPNVKPKKSFARLINPNQTIIHLKESNVKNIKQFMPNLVPFKSHIGNRLKRSFSIGFNNRVSDGQDLDTVKAFSESKTFIENLKVVFFLYSNLLNWQFSQKFKGISRILNFESVIKKNITQLKGDRKNLTTFLNELQRLRVEKNYQHFDVPLSFQENSIFGFSLKQVLELWNHQGYKYSEFYVKNKNALEEKFVKTKESKMQQTQNGQREIQFPLSLN